MVLCFGYHFLEGHSYKIQTVGSTRCELVNDLACGVPKLYTYITA